MAVDAAVVAMLVAAVADLALLSSLLRGRSRPQSRSLAGLLGASAWWAVAYAVELGATDADVAVAAGTLKYVGIVAVPPTMLLFVLRVTGRDRYVHARSMALLAVEPVVVLVLLLAPWTSAWFREVDAARWPGRDAVAVGPLFWAHMAYSLALLAAAVGVLVLAVARVSARYRPQAAGLLVALIPPFLANALFNFQVEPLVELDLTPVALALSGTLLVALLASFPLFHLVPVARSAVVDAIDDAVVVLDGDLVVVDVNPAAVRLLGDGLVGRPSSAFLREVPALHDDDDVDDAAGGARARREAVVLATPDGPRHVEIDVTRLRGQAVGGGRVVLIRDVTERHLAEARLERLAHYDVLTGLPNRELLVDRLDRALAHGRRHGEPVGVLYLDLDRFKVVNDTLGHAVGDELLAQVARRLLAAVREEDTVARLGGDEFAIVLPALDGPVAAASVAAALGSALRAPFTAGGHALYVTASTGVAVAPDDGADPSTLLRHADAAMYRAKSGGKDRVALHAARPEGEDVARLRLEADLHLCLERDELELWFQPVVRLADGTLAGAEALVRWRHHERGLLLPGDFVPLAEESGRITPIGTWVLEESCRAAATWRRAGTGEPGRADRPVGVVGVNLSPVQLRHPTLVTDVAAVLQRTGTAPGRVLVELSERTIVDDAPAVLPALHGLKDLGLRLAVDDFGTGSTSLRLLKRLPLDVLKIDRMFVEGLGRDVEDRAVVAAMVQVAHTLGMLVVAEGVERADQLDVLVDLGCDHVQGYLLARPLPADEMARVAAAGAVPRPTGPVPR